MLFRSAEWRQTIAEIRSVFKGLVSYNTDKYQEHNVTWWDCVDVISSSGYYPIEDWERQLDRIEAVAAKYQKPFFFAEAGCMSVAGSKHVPNGYKGQGVVYDRECCLMYKEEIDKLLGEDASTIVMDTNNDKGDRYKKSRRDRDGESKVLDTFRDAGIH